MRDELIGACLLAVAALIAAVGCGAWEAEATIGEIVHSSAITGRATIMGERRRALLRSGEAARAAGAEVATAVRARAAEWDGEFGDVVTGYNVLATAVNAYVREVLRAAKGESVTRERIQELAGDVATAWNQLVPLIERHGLTDVLPLIPEWVVRFLQTGDPAELREVTS